MDEMGTYYDIRGWKPVLLHIWSLVLARFQMPIMSFTIRRGKYPDINSKMWDLAKLPWGELKSIFGKCTRAEFRTEEQIPWCR